MSPLTNPKKKYQSHPEWQLINPAWMKSTSFPWRSINWFSATLHRAASSVIHLAYARRRTVIFETLLEQMPRTNCGGTSPYKQCHLSLLPLHMAQQLCRSPLLGILLRSSLPHKWKQRALWFSCLATLLVNRGDRGAPGNSIDRAHNETVYALSCRGGCFFCYCRITTVYLTCIS